MPPWYADARDWSTAWFLLRNSSVVQRRIITSALPTNRTIAFCSTTRSLLLRFLFSSAIWVPSLVFHDTDRKHCNRNYYFQSKYFCCRVCWLLRLFTTYASCRFFSRPFRLCSDHKNNMSDIISRLRSRQRPPPPFKLERVQKIFYCWTFSIILLVSFVLVTLRKTRFIIAFIFRNRLNEPLLKSQYVRHESTILLACSLLRRR